MDLTTSEVDYALMYIFKFMMWDPHIYINQHKVTSDCTGLSFQKHSINFAKILWCECDVLILESDFQHGVHLYI